VRREKLIGISLEVIVLAMTQYRESSTLLARLLQRPQTAATPAFGGLGLLAPNERL
jgi:hypothetical protein